MNVPKRIILHHSLTKDSGTVSWPVIRKYHTKVLEWDDIGYHFGIEKIYDEYEILVGRSVFKKGAHCYGQNRDSIGICFIGNFDQKPVPDSQLRKGIELVKSLMFIFYINQKNIFGHCDFSGKTCPGIFFDIEKFKNELD